MNLPKTANVAIRIYQRHSEPDGQLRLLNRAGEITCSLSLELMLGYKLRSRFELSFLSPSEIIDVPVSEIEQFIHRVSREWSGQLLICLDAISENVHCCDSEQKEDKPIEYDREKSYVRLEFDPSGNIASDIATLCLFEEGKDSGIMLQFKLSPIKEILMQSIAEAHPQPFG